MMSSSKNVLHCTEGCLFYVCLHLYTSHHLHSLSHLLHKTIHHHISHIAFGWRTPRSPIVIESHLITRDHLINTTSIIIVDVASILVRRVIYRFVPKPTDHLTGVRMTLLTRQRNPTFFCLYWYEPMTVAFTSRWKGPLAPSKRISP